MFLRQVTKNLLAYGAGQGLSRAVSVVLIVLLARHLPVEEMGRFSVLLTLLGLSEVVTVFGIDRLAVAAAAAGPAGGNTGVPDLVGLSSLLALLSAIVLGAYMWFSGMVSDSPGMAVLAGFCVLPATIGVVLDATAQGAQRMVRCSLGAVGSSLSWLAAILVAMKLDLGLPYIFAGLLLSHCVRVALLSASAGHPGIVRYRPDRWKGILAESAPYALSAVLGVVIFKQDLLIVSWLKGNEAAASYSVAFRFVEVAVYLSAIATAAMVPPMARLSKKTEELREAFRSSFRIGLLLAVPVSIGVFANAESLLRVIFSSKYEAAAPVLRILAFVAGAYLVYVPCISLFLAQQRRGILIGISAGTTVLNLLLNLVLVERFGPRGAAFAGLASVLFAIGLSLIIIRRDVLSGSLGRFPGAVIASLFGGGGMVLAMILVGGHAPALPKTLAGVGVHLGVVLFLGRNSHG